MSEHIERLIIKALQGNILPEEHYELDRWLGEDSANRKVYDEFVHVWKQSANGSHPHDSGVEKEWMRLTHAIDSPGANEDGTGLMTWAARIAAGIAFILLCTYLVTTQIPSKVATTFASGSDTLSAILPDGSRFTLNRNSSLSYRANFEDERSLTLEGEAFFEVREDKDHPFVVQTERASVKVLGTSFNVNSTASETRLTVVTGVVELSIPDIASPLKFTAGESGIATANSIIEAEDSNSLAWKNKILVFKDASLPSAIETIEKYFNKDLQMAENLSNCKITAEFRNPTLQEVMNVLRDALELDVEIASGQYIISGEGCDASQ